MFCGSADDVEGPVPASLIEDVNQNVAHEADPVTDRCLVDLFGRSLERPVDEHGPPDDVFTRDESPEAPVEGFGAVVAHGEDWTRGDDEVSADDAVGQLDRP